MNLMQGKFIVLDGPDGCGKSTQVTLLSEWIRRQGVTAVSYRDPGTTAVGEQIRSILLDPRHVGMGDNVEVLLYMAARAQLWKEKIGPDLVEGRCVVMDRWLSSTCAYQGWAGGFGIDKVIQIASDSLHRVWPDAAVILDVDPNTAAGRMKPNLDRMEQKGPDYHAKVREGFLKLARQRKDMAVVDASQDIQTVHQQILEKIQGILK
jgi:dTMP kinase